MASKKGSKFTSSFDTIYDLVFETSSGKPKKSAKPVKLKGTPSGTDLFADAIVEMVGKPLMYFGTALNDWVGDTYLDSAVVEVQAARALSSKGENTKVGKLKVKLKDLPNFIQNPDEMVDKVFEVYKQATKRSRWIQAGRALDAALVMMMAKRRHKISAGEAWAIGSAAGSYSSLNSDSTAFRNVARASTMSSPSLRRLNTHRKEQLAETVSRVVEHSTVQEHLRHGAYTDSQNYLSPNSITTRAKAFKAFKIELRKRLRKEERKNRSLPYSDELAEELFNQYAQTIHHFSPAERGAERFFYYAEPLGGQLGSSIDMAVTPGYTREAGKLYHEARLESLKREYGVIATKYRQLMNVYGPLRNLGSNRTDEQEESFRKLEEQKKQLGLKLRENQDQVEHSVDYITVVGVSQTQNGYYNQIRGSSNIEREAQRLLGVISSSSALSEIEKQRIIDDVRKSLAQYSNNRTRISGTLGLFTDPTGGVPKFYHQLVETTINTRIKELNDLIDAGGPSSAILRNEVRALQQELHDYKKFSKRGSYQFAISRLMSIYSNLQQISRGNWGELLLNGKLFYDAASPFAPGVMADYVLYTARYGKETVTDLVQDRTGINRGYASMTRFYYLTPGSFFKTIAWDGGHFNYFASRCQEQLFGYMQDVKILKLLKSSGFDIDIFMSGESFDISKWTPDNITSLMKFFKEHPDLKVGLMNISKKFPALYNALNRFATLGHIFSLPKRLWKKYFDKKFVPFLKEKVFGKFLQASLAKLFKNAAWEAAVKDFVANKIGMKQLFDLAANLIVKALNLVPEIGPIISLLLSLLGPAIMEKVAKPALKVFTAVIWGIFILLCAIGFSVLTLTSNPTKNVTPIDAVMSYSSPESVGKSTGEFDGEYDGDNKPVILEGDCMFDESFFCWQGILGYVDKAYNDKITGDPVCVKTYHSVSFARGVHSLDIHNSAIIKAPDDGIITFVSTDIQCGKSGLSSGGKVVFQSTGDKEYTITYLHVVPDQSIMENTRVVKGQVLAREQHGLSKSDCWTGDHIHVETSSFDLKKFIESTCGVSQLSCYYGDNPGDITEECKPFWGTQ